MTADDFRKDRYLRATGYNSYVWAAVNVLVTFPLYSARAGTPWPTWLAWLYTVGLLSAGIFLSVLNDNRVGKMCGAADPTPRVEAGVIWRPIFLTGLLFTVVFAVRGPAPYIQPLWMCLVGAGYVMVGNFGIPEFRLFGLTLAVAGGLVGISIAADSAPRLASSSVLAVWVVFMGALWVGFGACINRRYVHVKPRDIQRFETSRAAERAP